MAHSPYEESRQSRTPHSQGSSPTSRRSKSSPAPADRRTTFSFTDPTGGNGTWDGQEEDPRWGSGRDPRRSTIYVPPPPPEPSQPPERPDKNRTKEQWHDAMRRMGRAVAVSMDPNDLIDSILNWEELEETFHKSNPKHKPSTTSGAVACVKQARPDIYQRILQATHLKGLKIVLEMKATVEQIEASFKIHPARAASLIIHIMGTHEKSMTKLRVKSAIKKYLLTTDEHEQTFVPDCTECNLHINDLQENMCTNLADGQGYHRLTSPDPARSETHWLTLYCGIVEAVAYTPTNRFDLDQLERDWELPYDKKHTLSMRFNETLQDLLDRHGEALTQFVQGCQVSNKPDRIPRDHQLAKNLLRAIKGTPIKRECNHLLQDPAINKEGKDLTDMSYLELLNTLRLTEKRMAKTGLEEANPEHLRRTKGKGKGKSATPTDTKGNGKGGRGHRNLDQGAFPSPIKRERKYKCRTCGKYHPFLPDRDYPSDPAISYPCLTAEKNIMEGLQDDAKPERKGNADRFDPKPVAPSVCAVSLPYHDLLALNRWQQKSPHPRYLKRTLTQTLTAKPLRIPTIYSSMMLRAIRYRHRSAASRPTACCPHGSHKNTAQITTARSASQKSHSNLKQYQKISSSAQKSHTYPATSVPARTQRCTTIVCPVIISSAVACVFRFDCCNATLTDFLQEHFLERFTGQQGRLETWLTVLATVPRVRALVALSRGIRDYMEIVYPHMLKPHTRNNPSRTGGNISETPSPHGSPDKREFGESQSPASGARDDAHYSPRSPSYDPTWSTCSDSRSYSPSSISANESDPPLCCVLTTQNDKPEERKVTTTHYNPPGTEPREFLWPHRPDCKCAHCVNDRLFNSQSPVILPKHQPDDDRCTTGCCRSQCEFRCTCDPSSPAVSQGSSPLETTLTDETKEEEKPACSPQYCCAGCGTSITLPTEAITFHLPCGHIYHATCFASDCYDQYSFPSKCRWCHSPCTPKSVVINQKTRRLSKKGCAEQLWTSAKILDSRASDAEFQMRMEAISERCDADHLWNAALTGAASEDRRTANTLRFTADSLLQAIDCRVTADSLPKQSDTIAHQNALDLQAQDEIAKQAEDEDMATAAQTFVLETPAGSRSSHSTSFSLSDTETLQHLHTTHPRSMTKDTAGQSTNPHQPAADLSSSTRRLAEPRADEDPRPPLKKQREHDPETSLAQDTLTHPQVYVMSVDQSFIARPCTAGLPVSIGFDDQGDSLVYSVDTCAEVTLLNPRCVKSHWAIRPSPFDTIRGAGGETECKGAVYVPISFKYAMTPAYLQAYLAPTPDGVDLLLGIPSITQLNIVPYVSARRIHINQLQLEIDTESVTTVQDRLRRPPLRILMLCAGMGGGLTTLKELGFQIEIAHAVELDPLLQRTITSIHPDVKLIATDVMDITEDTIITNNYNYIDAGPPCQPWSRCSSPPSIGFGDTRAAVFTQCGKIKQWALNNNPQTQILMETVQIRKELAGDTQLQEMIMKTKSLPHEARTAGSLSRRSRNFFLSPELHIMEIPLQPARSLSLFLPVGAQMLPGKSIFPCVVSSTGSHDDPAYLLDGSKVNADPSELDVLQGFAPGISGGGQAPYKKPVFLSDPDRKKIIGQSFNLHQYRAIALAQYNKPLLAISRGVWSIHPSELTLDAFEKGMMTKTLPQKVQYFKQQLEATNYKEITCWLEPLDKEAAPYQAKSGYSDPKTVTAIEYALKKHCESGFLTEVKYDPSYWISPLFGKSKRRKWADGSDIEVYRCLWDLRSVNSSLRRQPDHYQFFMSSVEDIMLSIPADATHFGTIDYKDCFHYCPVEKSCQYYLVGIFNKRLYMASGMPQGLSHAPMTLSAHMIHGLNSSIGPIWRDFMTRYCDDYCVWGSNEQQTKLRLDILKAVSIALNKPISEKCDAAHDRVHETVQLVGIEISKGGNRLSQSALDMLTASLEKHPSSKTQLLRLLGVINYSKSAFDFNPTELLKVADLITILRQPLSYTRFSWGDKNKTAAKDLLGHITNTPRKLRNPATLLNNDTSIIITHDASDDNIAAAMWSVNHPVATEVTLEMLQDPEKAQLIDVKYKVISGARRDWLTFEKELWAKVMAAIEWGKFILLALTSTAKQLNTTINALPIKIMFLGDSTTADARWASLFIPEDLPYLTAKKQRMLGWLDKLTLWEHIPHKVLHIPGPLNHIADTVSHCADIMSDMQQARKSYKSPKTWPIRLHSFHGTNTPRTHEQPPDGFVIHQLNLTPKQVTTLVEAYKADSSTVIQKVPLSVLYAALAEKTIPEKHPFYAKAKAWAGTRFWALSPEQGQPPLLYTQASAQRTFDFEKHDLGSDLTKVLVMVIPDKADVQLTAARPPIDQDIHEDHWANMGLREHLLWSSHNTSAPHRTAEETILITQQKGWWPTLIAQAQMWAAACPQCVETRTASLSIGNAIMSKIRWGIVQADFKVLKKEASEKCGYSAILVMTDITTGITAASKAKTQDAVTVGRIFFTSWISTYAIPFLVISDPGSGLAAGIMATISKLLGISDWSYGATDMPNHQGLVERRNSVFGAGLKNAWDKGSLNNGDDLDLVIAEAMIVLNQLTHTYGSTAYERAFMAKPRTIHSAQLASSNTLLEVATTNEMEQTFIDQLSSIQSQLLQQYAIQKDARARTNAMHRQATEGAKTNVTHFDLRKGDTVSYGGIKWLLEDTEGPTPDSPISAILTRTLVNGKTETVKAKYTDLRPLCDPRFELMPPQNINPQIGDFALLDIKDMIHTGLITDLSGKNVTIHSCSPSATAKSWLPEWEDDGEIKRRKERPSIISNPCIVQGTLDQLIGVGKYDKKNASIDPALINQLKTANVLAYTTTGHDTDIPARSCIHNSCTAFVPTGSDSLTCHMCLGDSQEQCKAYNGLCAYGSYGSPVTPTAAVSSEFRNNTLISPLVTPAATITTTHSTPAPAETPTPSTVLYTTVGRHPVTPPTPYQVCLPQDHSRLITLPPLQGHHLSLVSPIAPRQTQLRLDVAPVASDHPEPSLLDNPREQTSPPTPNPVPTSSEIAAFEASLRTQQKYKYRSWIGGKGGSKQKPLTKAIQPTTVPMFPLKPAKTADTHAQDRQIGSKDEVDQMLSDWDPELNLICDEDLIDLD